MNINRRDFLIRSGLVVSSSLLVYGYTPKHQSSYRFFSDSEALCVIAMCEQIIPADQDPGATDAGVVYYIDRQMEDLLQHLQPVYRKGIPKVDESSASKHGKPFHELDFDQQFQFMQEMEKGEIPDWDPVIQKQFFNTVRTNTMQGFYGSPIHGGNKDYMSYTMMGLGLPLTISLDRYMGE